MEQAAGESPPLSLCATAQNAAGKAVVINDKEDQS